MKADFYKDVEYSNWHPINLRTGSFAFELADNDTVDERINEFRELAEQIADELPIDKVLLYARLKYTLTTRLESVNVMLLVLDYKEYLSIVSATTQNIRFYFVQGRKEQYENE